jgi:hypothetical protein
VAGSANGLAESEPGAAHGQAAAKVAAEVGQEDGPASELRLPSNALSTEEQARTGQLQRALRHPLTALIAVAVLAAASWSLWRAHQAALTASSQLWAPILNEPGQICLVLADLSASVSQQQNQPNQQVQGLLSVLRMGELVNYRDSMALSGVVAFLSRHDKPYTLELSTQASYPDLQHGASVLVGGLDNLWTMRVTDPLRFRFVRHSDSYVYEIADRQHPHQDEWSVNLAQPYDHAAQDYAIVARVFDQTTGRPVLIIAGLGANGTAAAANFLLDPERTAELTAQAPADWRHSNMEAVIRTQILDNHAGPPHLVASYFW